MIYRPRTAPVGSAGARRVYKLKEDLRVLQEEHVVSCAHSAMILIVISNPELVVSYRHLTNCHLSVSIPKE